MTQREAINMVLRVITAAEELKDAWTPRLAEMKFKPQAEADETARDYVRAVARKVSEKWSDEPINIDSVHGYN